MESLLKTYNRRIIILLFALLSVIFMVMYNFDATLKNEVKEHGIICFELAKDLDQSVKILSSWDKNENAKVYAGLNIGLDFLFIFVYSSLIALLIFNINNKLWLKKPFHKFGKILIALIFVAALFDIIENIALIKLLLGDLKQIWSSTAFYFASLKFLIILICIAYLIINWNLLLFKKKPLQ